MKILVDADACPVKEIIIKIAKQHHIPVLLFVDTSHILQDTYSQVITVDQANDSVDFALVNQTEPGDICVTQDYGLAAMLLAKKTMVIHQNGYLYTEDTIDNLLFERHISKKQRRSGKHCGHIKPRTAEDNKKFELCFSDLCKKQLAIQSREM